MGNKKKKIFSKVLTGAKKGFKETKEFVGTYGPRVNRGLSSVAESIQTGFTPAPQRQMKPMPMKKTQFYKPKEFKSNDYYLEIDKYGRRRYVKLKKGQKKRFDFNNIGMEVY